MKNPRNLLIFAIIGGVIGTGFGYTLGAIFTPTHPEKFTFKFTVGYVCHALVKDYDDCVRGKIDISV